MAYGSMAVVLAILANGDWEHGHKVGFAFLAGFAGAIGILVDHRRHDAGKRRED